MPFTMSKGRSLAKSMTQLLSYILLQLIYLGVLIECQEPSNVFCVNDDTPAGQRIGHITRTDNQAQHSLDPKIWKLVIMRADQIPATYFYLDPYKGELITKRIMDREELCPITSQHSTQDQHHQESIRTPVPKYRCSSSGHYGGPADPNWSSFAPHDCQLAFRVAIHRESKESGPADHSFPEFIDVLVSIIDRNDNVPSFRAVNNFVNLSVPESAVIGTRIGLPLAADPDSPKYSIQNYKLIPADLTEWTLHQQTRDVVMGNAVYRQVVGLFLEVLGELDREKKSTYSFEVHAYDTTDEILIRQYANRNVLKVYVTITDINDNGPVFQTSSPSAVLSDFEHSMPVSGLYPSNSQPVYRAEVDEGVWPRTALLTLRAHDQDSPKFAIIHYNFAPDTEADVLSSFSLDKGSGQLYLRQPLDYERRPSYAFDVVAVDGEHSKQSRVIGNSAATAIVGLQEQIYTATARVIINVKDINDEKPVISVDYLNFEQSIGKSVSYAVVSENSIPPQFVANLLVTDRDIDPANSHVSCFVSRDTASQAASGRIDANFSSFFDLAEVKRQPGRVEYNLLTSSTIDREKLLSDKPLIEVEVVCSDSGKPALQKETKIFVHVLDLNDNKPILELHPIVPIERRTLSAYMIEQQPNLLIVKENALIGTTVAQIKVTDKDTGDNGRVTCSIKSESMSREVILLDYFHLDPNSCELVVRKLIDRESLKLINSASQLHLVAEDHGKLAKSASMVINLVIIDENDNLPVLDQSVYHFRVKENAPKGTCVGTFLASDADSPRFQLTMHLQKHGELPFSIWTPNDTNSMESQYDSNRPQHVRFYLNTTEILDREQRESYKFKVLLLDSTVGGRADQHTVTASVFVNVEDVNDNDPMIIFPQTANKTFLLSVDERQHHQLMTISVNDKDAIAPNFIFEIVYEGPLNNMNKKNDEEASDKSQTRNHMVPDSFLEIERNSGTIFVKRNMMKNDSGSHAFVVHVSDSEVPPRSTSLRFLVNVDTIPPRLHQNSFSVEHSTQSSTHGKFQQRQPYQSSYMENYNDKQDLVEIADQPDDLGEMKSMKKEPRQRFPLQQLTGDAVLILSLALILLLLLSTLCLVVYARNWSTSSSRSQHDQRVDRRRSRCQRIMCCFRRPNGPAAHVSKYTNNNAHPEPGYLKVGDQAKTMTPEVQNSDQDCVSLYNRLGTIARSCDGKVFYHDYRSLPPANAKQPYLINSPVTNEYTALCKLADLRPYSPPSRVQDQQIEEQPAAVTFGLLPVCDMNRTQPMVVSTNRAVGMPEAMVNNSFSPTPDAFYNSVSTSTSGGANEKTQGTQMPVV